MKNIYFDEEDYGSNLSDEELIKIIRKESTDQLPALKELLKRNNQTSLKVAAQVLRAKKYHRRMKRTAVKYLGAAGGVPQARLLTNYLEREEVSPALARALVNASGAIGDKNTMNALEKIRDAPENRSFACTLISYKEGLNKHFIDLKDVHLVAPKASSLSVKIEELSSKRIEAIPNYINHGIQLKQHTLMPLAEMKCGNRSFFINLTNSFQPQANYELLKKQQAIPLLILQLESCPDILALKYYVMTHPINNGQTIKINLVNTSGRLCYSGEMIEEKGQLKFSLKTVKDSFTTPAIFEGEIAQNWKINFTNAEVSPNKVSGKTKIPARAS